MTGLVAVVLAGGRSSRFGSDKLAPPLAGRTLLEHTLDGLPAAVPVLVVGPERPLARRVRTVREDPPGGGPAAGLVAGLRAALDAGATTVAVLPGDAPAAGPAALAMVATLTETAPDADRLLVGCAADGRWQPLQLALTAPAAARLVAAAGPDGGAGASVRRLLESLTPRPDPWPLADQACLDVDAPADLDRAAALLGRRPRA